MKERWHLDSLTQVVMVFIVFGLTGTSVVFLKPAIFNFFGMEKIVGVKGFLLYCLLIFPLYQILLLFYGTVLGQFAFFWKWEKKMIHSMGKLFKRKKNWIFNRSSSFLFLILVSYLRTCGVKYKDTFKKSFSEAYSGQGWCSVCFFEKQHSDISCRYWIRSGW